MLYFTKPEMLDDLKSPEIRVFRQVEFLYEPHLDHYPTRYHYVEFQEFELNLK